MTSWLILDLIVVAVCVALAIVGGFVADTVTRRRFRRHPPELVRTNVRGLQVAAVLGDAWLLGTIVGLAILVVLELAIKAPLATTFAVAGVAAVMWAVGAWDDRRGDERPRGFRGHLGALRSGALTGGLLKIAGGMVAGVTAAALIPARGASPATHVAETVMLVALTANLTNLFDRAPGRAGKVALLLALPLVVFGDRFWILSAMPALGALVACLRHDLAERAMLGDAGANPIGAVVGVGLAVSLSEPWRLVAIAILLVLNLASERWSFSRVIESTPPLRWADELGRKDRVAAK